jgi:Leucine-rich repeat (LRR) protein
MKSVFFMVLPLLCTVNCGAELVDSVRPSAGIPPNLKRLFASHNKIALLSDIPLLRGLECLQELSLDSNPIMTTGHANVRQP